MKKTLLAFLIGLNAIVLVAQIPIMDILYGMKKGIVMSYLYDLRHRGIIESDRALEISLALFGFSEDHRAEGENADVVFRDLDDNSAVQDGKFPLIANDIFTRPRRMSRAFSILLLANVLTFLLSWRCLGKQWKEHSSWINGKLFSSRVLVPLLLLWTGIDLLAGVLSLPLSKMVAKVEYAQVANCFRKLQHQGITSRYAFDREMHVVFGNSSELRGIAGFATVLLLMDASVHILSICYVFKD